MGIQTAPEEFSRLYEEVYKDMYKFAFYMLGNSQDAEDAVSDAVLDGYRGFAGLRQRASFRPWIFKILAAKCKRKRKEYLIKNEELPQDFPSSDDFTEYFQIRHAFAKLSHEERLILSLHLFGGYTSKEIGKELSLKDTTVRSKESRALKKMRSFLSLPKGE